MAAHEDLLHLILQLVLDAEDVLLGPVSAAYGATTDDDRRSGMSLELATASAGPAVIVSATHAAGAGNPGSAGARMSALPWPAS